jgi:hypothetical protein
MKTQKKKPALNETHGNESKPRFQIEKLEERIAPSKGRHWYHPTPRFCRLYPQYCS